jgi:hypothetical protein
MRTRYCAMLLMLALLSGCKVENAEKNLAFGYGPQARLAIEAFGFTDVKLVGLAIVGCGRDDSYRVEFEGTGPRGHHVTGLVCAGIFFKGWTVRLNEISEPVVIGHDFGSR